MMFFVGPELNRSVEYMRLVRDQHRHMSVTGAGVLKQRRLSRGVQDQLTASGSLR